MWRSAPGAPVDGTSAEPGREGADPFGPAEELVRLVCLGGLADEPVKAQAFVSAGNASLVQADFLPDLHERVVGRLVQVGLPRVLVGELLAALLERRR
jgi:hypothetical protein